MPRNKLYDRTGSTKVLVEQVACSTAMKVPETLNAKIEKVPYTPPLTEASVLPAVHYNT